MQRVVTVPHIHLSSRPVLRPESVTVDVHLILSPRISNRLTPAKIGWLTVVGILLLAPLATPFVPSGTAAIIHMVYGSACHQLPDRTFAVGGVAFAVCQRCLGIYVGVFVGTLLSLVFPERERAHRRWGAPAIVVAVLLLGLEWTAGFVGIGLSDGISRLVTGALFGIVAGIFLGDAIADVTGKKQDAKKVELKSGAAISARGE